MVKKTPDIFEISDCAIDMVAEDLNDYDYLDWRTATIKVGDVHISAPCIGSTIQCGYGLNGNTVGEVFWTRIEFERTFDFAPIAISK